LFQLCAEAKDMLLKCHPINAVESLERFKEISEPDKMTEIEIKLYVTFDGRYYLFVF